jgi:tetratricopeptide (TPR) repeat protein
MFAAVLESSHERTLSARAYRAIALAYVGRSGEAREEAQAVVREARSAPSGKADVPLYVLGTILRLAGEPAEARRIQTEALAAIPPHPREDWQRMLVVTELGLDEVALGRFAEAEARLEQALELFVSRQDAATPHRADALVGLGQARIGTRRFREAVEVLEQADGFWRDFDGDNRWAGEAAFWLSRAYEAAGRSEEAMTAYDRAVSILARSPLPIDAELLRTTPVGRE